MDQIMDIDNKVIEVTDTIENDRIQSDENDRIQSDENEKTENVQQMGNHFTVDVIIPTYRADEKFDRLIEMLFHQTVQPNKVIILHTIEEDGQQQALPVQDSRILVVPINKADFDHGGTRKYGASLSKADIIMFMTQDAVPSNEFLIEELIKPYLDEEVAATYGKQLPDNNTDILEAHTRRFNYPDNSFVKSKNDLPILGIKTFFCSNVCATYRKTVYETLGGFVDRTIFNEDMIYASKVIQSGYKIAYVATAEVIHAHNYSYLEQFNRNFDLGVSHKQYEKAFYGVKSETEGIKLVKNSIEFLIERKKYFMIIDLILNSGFKFLGYQLGVRYQMMSLDWVARFSMNKSYWKKA